jgi:hypothetical protein
MRLHQHARQLERHDPVATLIDSLLANETESQRWFRLASQRLSQMNEESSK